MNVKHFYLEPFVTLIGIFSYNFNKSANTHTKVWLHTLPMEASGMELNLVSWVCAKDSRVVPMLLRWLISPLLPLRKKQLVPLVFAFQGTKIESRLASSLERREQWGLLPWRKSDGSFLGATLPGRGQDVPSASHRWLNWTPAHHSTGFSRDVRPAVLEAAITDSWDGSARIVHTHMLSAEFP